jgi:hypothetical protein
MNSREQRKLAAQQHNDQIDYEKWLKENTKNQRQDPRVLAFSSGRKTGLSRLSALKLIVACGMLSV